MKKLICDRCGFELEGKEELELVLEGQAAWEKSARDRGAEPRGLFPCKHYRRCGGEMIVFTGKQEPPPGDNEAA